MKPRRSRYAPVMARVGIREVATLAEVSLGTVSHYINHPEGVAREARAHPEGDRPARVRAQQRRVAAAARPVGHDRLHRPRRQQPVLRDDRRGRRAARRRARPAASSSPTPTAAARARTPTWSCSKRSECRACSWRRTSRSRSGSPGSASAASRRCWSASAPSRGPAVGLDRRRHRRLPGRAASGRDGRKRIAFVGGPLGIRQVADRLEGAGKAMREAGDVDARGDQRREPHDRRRPRGRRTPRGAPGTSRPDAMFAVNDLTALGLMQGLGSRTASASRTTSRSSATTTSSSARRRSSRSRPCARRTRASGSRPSTCSSTR